MFIIVEYKNKKQSGAQGNVAVWEFMDEESAKKKMGELAENNLPLELFEAQSVSMFH